MGIAQLLAARSIRAAQTMVDPYAMAAMNSSVRIFRKGVWDDAKAEWDMTAATVVYADPDDDTLPAIAGIATSQGPSLSNFGDEPEQMDSITVYIPRSSGATPMIDDVIEVWAAPDADLANRYFQVDSVPTGGRLISSISILASGPAPTRRWTKQ